MRKVLRCVGVMKLRRLRPDQVGGSQIARVGLIVLDQPIVGPSSASAPLMPEPDRIHPGRDCSLAFDGETR
jgi:hypothetical protein